jgi:hypothetical protein
VEEGVGAWVHARLGRQLNSPRRERPVRGVDEVELLGRLGKQLRDLVTREVEELAHR